MPERVGEPTRERSRYADGVPPGVRLVATLVGFVLVVGGSVLLVHRNRPTPAPAGLLDPVWYTAEEVLLPPLQRLLAAPAARAVATESLVGLPAYLTDTVAPLSHGLAAYPAGGRLAVVVAPLRDALGGYTESARRLLVCVDAAAACTEAQAAAEQSGKEVDRLAGDLRLYAEG